MPGPNERSRACIEAVDAKLDSYKHLMTRVTKVVPTAVAAQFPYDSRMSEGLVCLQDAKTSIGQALYGLHEYCARLRDLAPPDEAEAFRLAWEQRFYVEDTAMRLYSAAEHTAEAIACLAAFDRAHVNSQKGVSQWVKVRRAVARASSWRPLHESMCTLQRSQHWKRSIEYRHAVVHQQPPLLGGSGLAWSRRNPWTVHPDGSRAIVFRLGDLPRAKAYEIHADLRDALAGLIDVATLVLENYWVVLNARMIVETPTGMTVPLSYVRD